MINKSRTKNSSTTNRTMICLAFQKEISLIQDPIPSVPMFLSRPYKSLLSSSFLKTIKAHGLPRILAAQEES